MTNYRIYDNIFEWSLEKAQRNFEKHGVSFEDAAFAYSDPVTIIWEDHAHSLFELRFGCIGRCELGKILMVVYTMRRLSDEKETIRIISARQANKKEREVYARL